MMDNLATDNTKQVCVWEPDEEYMLEGLNWTSGCGYSYSGDPDQFIWCPYCGEKISINPGPYGKQ
jgi:hypothetical protein